MPAATIPFTSAGSKLSISAVLPATFDAAGYGALTFAEVGEVTDLGEFGREYALVTHNPIGTRKTLKRKGSYNEGALALQMARVPGDAGHIILIAARDDDASYAFSVELQDGTLMYFTAQTMSYKTGVGSVDTITGATANLEIDSDEIVEVAPV